MSVHPPTIRYRGLTDDEVAFFREHGWVKVDQLIGEEAAAELLAHVQSRMGADASGSYHPQEERVREAQWNQWVAPWQDAASGEVVDDLLYSATHSPQLGQICEQLGGRPYRYWTDKVAVKMPSGAGGSDATPWHADLGAVEVSPFDPPEGQLQVWLALKEVTPQQGAMRFIAPGDLDDEVQRVVAERSVEESYPELDRRGVLSPPLHYRPGDATIHGSEALHSAQPNRTGEARWGYILSLFPADARYSGKATWVVAGQNLEPGRPFPDEQYPVLA
jgi:hypothetical protein